MRRADDAVLSILDVGARHGAATIFPKYLDASRYLNFLHQKFFKIYAVEPDTDASKALISDHHYSGVFVDALFSKTTNSELYITKAPECSSLLKPHTETIRKHVESNWWANFEIVEKRSVATKSLDDFVKEYQLEIDLIKIDAQGVEYDIVDGGRTAVMNSIAVIAELSEVPWYEKQKNLVQFTKLMNELDFFPALHNHKPHIPIEKDVLFVKKFDKVDSRDALMKLVLVLYMFNLEKEMYKLADFGRKKRIIGNIELIMIKKITSTYLKFLI